MATLQDPTRIRSRMWHRIDMNIFETLKELSNEQHKKERPPMRIYQDEQTGEIKEEPLSQSDMAASAYIKSNPAKLIRDLMFGY